ncbi:enoyl-CoA hydratase/isomerase family protein [Streptomyces sp. NPDC001984]
MNWDKYKHLDIRYVEDGILQITINRPAQLNAMDQATHREMSEVWDDVSKDPDTRVVLVTGAGRAFSAGGDFDMAEAQIGSYDATIEIMHEAERIVTGIVQCDKPVVSAINGVAVGAGLAVALVADISIAAESARITDGHLRLGVAAGDHAPIIWPLLCSMAKAKYYLLTSEFLNGAEAERIGLVSKCVPDDRLMDEAMAVARKLAHGPQFAIWATKRTLNHWVRDATPIFEAALAYEMLGFFSPDVRAGMEGLKAKSMPRFPSAGGTNHRAQLGEQA